MSHSLHHAPNLFGGYPYLLIPQSSIETKVVLLPTAMNAARLSESAKAATNKYCRQAILMTGSSQDPVPCDSAYYSLLTPEKVANVFPTTELAMRKLALNTWHCYHKGFEVLDSTGPHQTTQIHRFLSLAHRCAANNPLLELPPDGSELLTRLSWYRNLDAAWAGGWLRGDWRTWLVEVAIDSGLLPRHVRRQVSAIHSGENALPGATSETFGRALERGIPNLFEEIDSRVLRSSTRESTINFRVA